MDINSESVKPKKALVVFSTSYPGSLEYLVFVVDLKLDGGENEIDLVKCMNPTVRFDCSDFHNAAFCMVESEVYVFPGYNEKYNPDGGKSMFTYRLCDGISNLKLGKEMLSHGLDMCGIKVKPRATVTPEGMILVFSSLIYDRSRPNKCDFELYDPKKRTWYKLPNLCPSSLRYTIPSEWSYFLITSFTIMENNVLFLLTNVGNFTLDITRKIWKNSGFIPPHPGNSFVMIGKEICIIPYYAYDVREPEEKFATMFFTFPQLSLFPTGGYSYNSGGVILLEDIRQVKTPYFNLCLLHSGKNEETEDNEFVLQVYCSNLNECIMKISEHRQKKFEQQPFWMESFVLPGTTKLRSLKVVFKDESASSFGLCSFAYIPVVCASKKSTRKRKI